ncbi:MAG: cation:proton antiporter [Firmicutes bacterium]|nr:cation:proton antiporter [Bacillota bacterium]MBQ6606848.1 cation:proton antiporter [Bacillota bacterium]
MDYTYILWLAVILLATKALGLMTEKAHQPQVVGALLAGIILGPSCFNVMESTEFIMQTAEIGVLMLMFMAGLDTDIQQLKRTGPTALFIAVLGVIVPLLLCGGAYLLFLHEKLDFTGVMRGLYVGTVFAATSVSITVETLTEMGKLNTQVGATILGAALIDDIVGIIILSVIDSVSQSGSSGGAGVFETMMFIFLFFLFTLVVGMIMIRLFRRVTSRHAHSRRLAVWALAFCFLMSWSAEELFGVADITGAYFAGLILCNLSQGRKFIAKKMAVASYILFAPVFFASVGLRTNLRLISGDILLLTVILLLCALASKLIGCGGAAKVSGLGSRDALSVSIGMMSRGEVGLMAAQKGMASGMIDESVFPAVILVVVVSCLVTPVLLKLSMAKPTPGTAVQTAEAEAAATT